MVTARSTTIAAIAMILTSGCHAYVSAAPMSPPATVIVRDPAEIAPPVEPAPMASGADEYADNDPSALTDFRDTLDPHGMWIEDETYGTVWVPAREEVGPDFVPYVTAGHWVYDDDYVWVSSYSWGWVPFHYGRWVFIGGWGWVWIPGRAYADAWVVWRVGDDDVDFVGWAPMPPTWIWRHHVAIGVAVVPPPLYVYCPRREVFAPVVVHRIVRGPAVVAIEHRTRPYIPPPIGVARPFFSPRAPLGRLRIDPGSVPHPPPQDHSLDRARQYRVPSAAQRAGGRPPAPRVLPPPLPPRTVVRPAVPPSLGTAMPQPPSRPAPASRPAVVPRPPTRVQPPPRLPRPKSAR